MRSILSLALLLAAARDAHAATYTVGPGQTYPTLNALFTAVDLGGGDIVEVMSGPTYAGNIVMPSSDGGAPGNPVILRGVGPVRPHLSGGTNTVEFRLSNHVVMERFEISGSAADNTFRCVYHHAHDIVLRDVLIHDCPRHGVLGSDQDSGSLTIEYSEIRNAGSGGGNHAIYMATDEVAYPGAVFRLQYSYIHDSDYTDGGGIGGNLIKSRAERNEIYYNWLEGAFYHELELIGPDPEGAAAGWSDALVREDSDVVGNVILHTSDFGSVLRFGGDGTSDGRGETFGRYRVVNNTIIRRGGGGTSTIFRLFEGIEALQFHNNIIWREGAGSMVLVRAASDEVEWLAMPKVSGSNNWIETGYTLNPPSLPVTIAGTVGATEPAFENLAAYDLTPAFGSSLLDAGNLVPVSPAGYEIDDPLAPPTRQPPRRLAPAPGSAVLRPLNGAIDVGAFEREDDQALFRNGFEN